MGYGSSQVLAKLDFQNHVKKKNQMKQFVPTIPLAETGGAWEFVGQQAQPSW